MNEEGDTPSGSQTTDQDKKNDSIASKVISYLYLIFISIFHYLGLEKKCVVDELENEVKLLKNSESDLKSRTSQLENEVELMTIDKKVSDAKITDKDNEIKSTAEENEYLKTTQAKTEGEWNNRMTEKESEIKSKDEEIQNLKSRISQLKEEVKSANDNSKIMIRAKFTEISKITLDRVYSEPTEFAGVTWKISVYKPNNSRITFFLDGEKENDVDWIYLVNAEFRLISQKSKEIIHRNERKLIYDAKHSSYWVNYIMPEDLFNQEKGFVKDDSIIVAVTIRGIPTD